MAPHSRTVRTVRISRGFTLIEVLVALTLLSLILIAFLTILDTSARVAKTQGNIADSTENLRFSVAALVRTLRMAGSGGAPLVYESNATGGMAPLALEVRDNANPATESTFGTLNVVNRVPGTDVLKIKGVITRPMWEVQGANTGEVTYDSGANGGQIMVRYVAPFSLNMQGPLLVPNPDSGIILLLQGERTLSATNGTTTVYRHFSDYRVVRVKSVTEVNATSPPAPTGTKDLQIDYSTQHGDDNSDGIVIKVTDYNPSGTFPGLDPTTVMMGGILDEMTFFVGVNPSGLPSLYREDGEPQELVPNISDLQVAVFCDLNLDGVKDAGEWFFTAANPSAPTPDQMLTMQQVRISIVARNADPELDWDEDMSPPENSPALSADERRYRHRPITVRVMLRSQPPPELS